MRKVALITGITGQDGSYLAELLLEKGYEVHGLRRKTSVFNTKRIDHLLKDWHNKDNKIQLHYADLSDGLSLVNALSKIRPTEIYNLAAMSHVAVSFLTPESTGDVDALGTLRLLEAMKILDLTETRLYQASTSELYGKVREIPQNENTPFHPRSPYAVAKLYSYWIVRNYRESYGVFASNGILFNHESPRRGRTFVTRKITYGVAQIAYGIESCLYLGNLDSERDWGHAKDYVEGMWRILQHNEPDDFVLATGQKTTVRQFVKLAFDVIGVSLIFKGDGLNEYAVVDNNIGEFNNIKPGDVLVKVDEMYFRPAEVELLIGDASKAKDLLAWQPSTTLNKLVEEMVNSDLTLLS